MKGQTFIKAYLFCLLALTALSVSQIFAEGANTNEWGPITNDARISIGLKGGGAPIKTNQPFSLLIRINNLSTNRTISLYEWLAIEVDPGFSHVVISPSGKDVSPVMKIGAHGSGGFAFVPPMQIHEREIKLSYLCNFDEIGTYKIIVKFDVGELNKPAWMISNPLYVTVVPGEWKPDKKDAPPTGF